MLSLDAFDEKAATSLLLPTLRSFLYARPQSEIYTVILTAFAALDEDQLVLN